MDRIARKDYDWLISRKQTAYQVLEINSSSTLDVIRKAYRKKALVLHPDKNKSDNAQDKFREINIGYNILIDPDLKKEYDEYLNTNKIKVRNKNIKNDLKEMESQYKLKKSNELLKRQKVEQLNVWYDNYIKSNINIPSSTTTASSIFPTTVLLKWKNKESINFDRDLIIKLMQVFGTIEHVELKENNPSSNYHFSSIKYKSPVGSALASTHDFSKTADYWDSINLRKIASLLRSVKLIGYDKIDVKKLNFLKLSSLDYIAFSIVESICH